ncbi:hypothetical protein [Pelagerythrobacter marinus]|uniref:hypothetical protein n=1 Tax=Pelagerythrobacter marinus TaxID=538382 RepID=UPI002036D34C|nr:hypothetical protein [Pelagerythrobacter marinus]USA38304.1 hypothetical protein NCF86_08105 [Pelagerythrobacter marinus]WPZ07734.1 hypothetical protein T8T98_04245 [Pelagerythrobacter marinus]
MRNIVLTAAVAALCACSGQGDETPADAPAADTAAAPAAGSGTAALASDDAAGDYEVTWADGTVTTTTINADGTYVDTMDGEETARGSWVVRDDRNCLTPEGGAELCWTDSPPAEDGSWTATAEDGTTVTVARKTADDGA